MVRILANGDIVQDDDPRAQQPRGGASGGARGPRMGHVRQDEGGAGQQGQYGQQQQAGMMGQQVSIFTVFNQKLLGMGFPRFSLGSTIGDIEPIVSVGFLLAGLLFGLPGLFFGAILFAVCKVSMGGGQGQGQQGQGRQGPGRHAGQHYNPPGGRR